MNHIMNLNEKHVNIFNWQENPFSFKILPELFVGYVDETEKLFASIYNNEKISLLIGPTGSGKTTLLKFFVDKFKKDRKVLYLSKPPKNPEDWVKIFMNFIDFGILERLFSNRKNLNLYNLSDWMNKKMKNKKAVIFIDESHEASIETLEWLRTLTDQIDNLSTVITGLPVIESVLGNNLETFMRRVNTKVELTNLTKSETRELIKKRIEWVGGDDIKPFTSETIEYIYEKTGGFPREIIRACNDLVKKSIENKISTIDMNFLKDSDIKTPRRVSFASLSSLPSKQRDILEILTKNGELTPSEIVDKMNLEAYRSKDNAIRSVNNILKRLVREELILRKRRGKSYQYTLSDKMRTLLVDA